MMSRSVRRSLQIYRHVDRIQPDWRSALSAALGAPCRTPRNGNTSSSTLRGHEAIFRYTVNSVSKFFLNSCTCAHSVRSRKPLCGPSRSKEKCAQCMTSAALHACRSTAVHRFCTLLIARWVAEEKPKSIQPRVRLFRLHTLLP